MGSHNEEPVTPLPTRRSLREAQRRAAEVDPAPTPAHHVPTWAHQAAPAVRPSAPAGSPTRSAWSSGPVAPTRLPRPDAVPAAPVPAPSPRPAALVSRAAAPAASPAVVAPAPAAVVDAAVERHPAPAAASAPARTEAVPAVATEEPELAVAAHGTVRRRSGRPTRTAARLSVLGVLAGITVVVPVSQGVVAGPAAFGSDALADSTLPSTVTALAGAPLSALPPSSLVSADGALQARGVAAASRTEERSLLPGCDGSTRPSGQNGLLKVSDLCTLWDNHTQLRADAAVSLAEFNQAFAARFGRDLCLSSGYRTLAAQRAVKAQKGGLAAVPGKSNHGWGLAVDLCQDQTSGAKWTWINENGPTYGWANPAWAKPGGSGPHERWHWEFTKGVQQDGEYYDG